MTLHVTTLHLNHDHPAARREMRDVCARHSRVIDATVGMDTTGPRILFAVPRPYVLVIRAPEPIDAARLPRGYATEVHARPWSWPHTPGRWLMAGVLNPGRNTNVGGPTLNQPDRKRRNGQPLLITGEAEQRDWLGRRLENGATVVDFVAGEARTVVGAHRTGRTITIRQVPVQALVDVFDPDAIAGRLLAGVGMDKAWGCGLTVWEHLR